MPKEKCCCCCCCREIEPLEFENKSIKINYNKEDSYQFNNVIDLSCNENCCNEKCCNSFDLDVIKEDNKIENKSIKNNFNFDDIILNQDIIEGNWKKDTNIEILMEEEKDLFEKIKKFSENKGINDENGVITLFILYYIFKKKPEKVEELKFVIEKAKKYIKKIYNLEYDDIAKELDSN